MGPALQPGEEIGVSVLSVARRLHTQALGLRNAELDLLAVSDLYADIAGLRGRQGTDVPDSSCQSHGRLGDIRLAKG